MSKLIDEYPVLELIKEKLKENKKISKDQIKDYNRRLTRSPLLKTHLEMLQNYQNRVRKKHRQHKEEKAERERLEGVLRHKSAEYDKLKTRIIDTFGVKSTEYELLFPGEKKLQGSDNIYDTTPEGMMNYIKKHNS